MTPAPPSLAPWFAFAGRALLSTDADALRELAAELTEAVPANEDLSHLSRALAESLPPGGNALETEYVRLFFDPLGAPCMIWQSAHDAAIRLMGPSHESALVWFRRYGIEPATENQPADHAGLLLSFYARLLAEGAALEERSRFLREHLSWLPSLCEEMDRHARLAFYQNISHLIRLLVEMETPADP